MALVAKSIASPSIFMAARSALNWCRRNILVAVELGAADFASANRPALIAPHLPILAVFLWHGSEIRRYATCVILVKTNTFDSGVKSFPCISQFFCGTRQFGFPIYPNL